MGATQGNASVVACSMIVGPEARLDQLDIDVKWEVWLRLELGDLQLGALAASATMDVLVRMRGIVAAATS